MISWKPNQIQIESTHIFQSMQKLGFPTYEDFWKWSVSEKENFWKYVIDSLSIKFEKQPLSILDLSKGVANPNWLHGALFNIIDSCFQAKSEDIAIIYQNEQSGIEYFTYLDLEKLINQIANALQNQELQKGDTIAIDLPMNVKAVALYLAAIKAGLSVATIADSFSSEEIKVRLEITSPKIIFTQYEIERGGKSLHLYEKVLQAEPKKIVLIDEKLSYKIRKSDLQWNDFIVENDKFESVKCKPDCVSTILFSSGTTSAPKAIPWTHVTPIKCASDGFFHQDIQPKDVVAWPTNLGWMMGPWLVFATLINKATLAIYDGSPLGKDFGLFVQNAKVNMLGIVPSIVKQWKLTKCMEKMDLSALKCFSSTGEASNPEDYSYLMQITQKPIIEYCGGTEIGGGYLCSTLVQDNFPSTFSTKALGSDFLLLNENHQLSELGEVYIIPPGIGLSNTLLNKDHNKEYYEGILPFEGKILRRHGDQVQQLTNGYFKAQGRIDDAMNLGGIKVSSIQIEEVINSLDFVKESAAIGVAPSEGGPERLVIYITTKELTENNNAKLLITNIVKERINPLFKVSDVVEISILPRTASGKIMRRELRKNYNLTT
jgi:acetyl-CoA synthetase